MKKNSHKRFSASRKKKAPAGTKVPRRFRADNPEIPPRTLPEPETETPLPAPAVSFLAGREGFAQNDGKLFPEPLSP